MLLRPLFFTSFLIDDQLADEGLADARADRDLERLEQDRDRRRLPARPARRSRARRPHLAAQRRVRRGPRHLRPHRHLRRDRLARARPGHLRRRLRRRRGAPSGPRALRRRARPQHGGRGHALGGARRRARASCPGRRRPSSSRPTASSSAAEDWGRGGLETARRRGLAPVLRVDRRLAGDDRRPGLRGRPGAPTSTCSRAASTRSRATCSRSERPRTGAVSGGEPARSLARITGVARRLPARRWRRAGGSLVGGQQLRQLAVLLRDLAGAEDGRRPR